MQDIISQVQQEINSRYSEQVPDFPLDGKIFRCGQKDHIWIAGNTWQFKGKDYASVRFGSWKFGDSHELKSWSASEETKGFRQALTKQTQETQAKLKLDKMEKHKACKMKWKPIFDMAESADHGYLSHKEIKPFNSKVLNDILMIPAYGLKGFVGVQRIFENPKTGRFEKRFSTGIEIRGAISPLSSFKDSELCFVTEGFATGATIQELFPEIPVIVCFSAGNIVPAIETIRIINPKIKIIIAGDNDAESKTGEKSCKKAVQQFLNCIYRIPQFKTKNNSWSDYNDLANFESRESVIEQLTISAEEFTNVIPMGYLNSIYYYTSTSNQQIIPISAGNHNKNTFFQLANIKYWLKSYGIKDPDTGDYKGVDWTRATSELMDQCREAGLFIPDNIRGRAVWLDDGQPIINTGAEVYPALKSSRFHYQKSVKIDYSYDRTATDDEMIQLLTFFKKLKYKNPLDYFYLSAWYVQAQIFSCLEWRFHLWLTADRGTGKTTILKWMNDLLINPLLTNDTTSAGIRQELKGDAFVTIFDEAEPRAERTKQVVELARQMSSNGNYKILRGTVHGESLKFNTQTLFLFASIQVADLEASDKSRIFRVEMAQTRNQTEDERTAIYETVEHFTKIKNRVFGRCFEGIQQINRNYAIAQRVLREARMEARQADQFAMAISCFYMYFDEGEISEEWVKRICSDFKLLESDYAMENTTKDSDECLADLLQTPIDKDGRTVAYCIESIKEATHPDRLEELHRYLGTHGLRYFHQQDELFVSPSSEMKKKMRRFPAYFDLLKRDSAITVNNRDTQRIKAIGPKAVKGIRVKL
jgi:putative DNA primase/helicase